MRAHTRQRVSGFKMAKYLGKHLRQDDRAAVKAEVKSEAESSDEEEDEDAKPKKKKAIKTEGKKAKGGGGDGGGGGGLNKELNWGADMAAFLGTDLMSRPQVSQCVDVCGGYVGRIEMANTIHPSNPCINRW